MVSQKMETTAEGNISEYRKRDAVKAESSWQNNPAKDRISEVPDDIVILMLSRLQTSEAARTSILSKRWRYMWTYSPCFDFDDLEKSLSRGSTTYKDVIQRDRTRFVNWVYHAINMFRGSSISTFRVCFGDVEDNHRSDIDRWVDFAMRNQVQEMLLELDKYRFFSRSVLSYGRNFLRNSQPCYSLKSLCLIGMYVTSKSLELILLKCPLLEKLSLLSLHVYTSRPITLNVAGKSLKLKHLEIQCNHVNVDLQICAPQLTSLVYEGTCECIFGEVPSLTDLTFKSIHHDKDLVHIFNVISSFSVQLQKLVVLSHEFARFPNKFPEFANIEQLKLELYLYNSRNSIDLLASFMNACPRLRKLRLEFYNTPENPTDVGVSNRSHLRLEEVEITGFNGGIHHVKIAEFVCKNSIMLAKFTIDTSQIYETFRKKGRSEALKLKALVHPSVDVVII